MSTLFSGGYKAAQREWSGYSNDLFKWEVIGTCKAIAHGRMSFHMAFEEVRQHQPNVSTRLKGEAQMLHGAVAMALATNPDQLELCTAAGSSLDVFYGIGGFFVFEGVVVTFDVVMSIPQHIRTDVLVTRKDVLSGYGHCAGRIAGCFNRKISSGRGLRT